MPGLSSAFSEYSSDHRTRGNRLCHLVSFPLVLTGLLGLLSGLILPGSAVQDGLFRVDAGVALWALGLLGYVFLDWRMTIPFSMVTLGLYFLGRSLSAGLLWGILILGLALLVAGHAAFERNLRAAASNPRCLAIGPFWGFARIFGFSASRDS
ncbi:MAG: DUF962 domain-containing protein [Oligoflexia bacterium]|nr:DUF962 domain-containing protein [Oligoflexia bacterium]